MWAIRKRVQALGCALLCLLTVNSVQAAVIDPESLTLELEPGQTSQQIVTISNDSGVRREYVLNITAVTFGAEAEDLRFGELDADHRSWVSLPESSFVLQPLASKSIPITLSIPADAKNEVFAFALIATTQGEPSSGVTVESGLASLFFVNVGGVLPSDLEISAFETLPTNPHRFPIRFATLLNNTGAGLAQPSVIIEIRNIFGKVVDILSLNDLGRRVPGHTSRVFSAEWSGQPWFVGPHTATLIVMSNENATPQTTNLNVVLFPWQLLVLLGVSMLVLLIALSFFVRARRR